MSLASSHLPTLRAHAPSMFTAIARRRRRDKLASLGFKHTSALTTHTPITTATTTTITLALSYSCPTSTFHCFQQLRQYHQKNTVMMSSSAHNDTNKSTSLLTRIVPHYHTGSTCAVCNGYLTALQGLARLPTLCSQAGISDCTSPLPQLTAAHVSPQDGSLRDRVSILENREMEDDAKSIEEKQGSLTRGLRTVIEDFLTSFQCGNVHRSTIEMRLDSLSSYHCMHKYFEGSLQQDEHNTTQRGYSYYKNSSINNQNIECVSEKRREGEGEGRGKEGIYISSQSNSRGMVPAQDEDCRRNIHMEGEGEVEEVAAEEEQEKPFQIPASLFILNDMLSYGDHHPIIGTSATRTKGTRIDTSDSTEHEYVDFVPSTYHTTVRPEGVWDFSVQHFPSPPYSFSPAGDSSSPHPKIRYFASCSPSISQIGFGCSPPFEREEQRQHHQSEKGHSYSCSFPHSESTTCHHLHPLPPLPHQPSLPAAAQHYRHQRDCHRHNGHHVYSADRVPSKVLGRVSLVASDDFDEGMHVVEEDRHTNRSRLKCSSGTSGVLSPTRPSSSLSFDMHASLLFDSLVQQSEAQKEVKMSESTPQPSPFVHTLQLANVRYRERLMEHTMNRIESYLYSSSTSSSAEYCSSGPLSLSLSSLSKGTKETDHAPIFTWGNLNSRSNAATNLSPTSTCMSRIVHAMPMQTAALRRAMHQNSLVASQISRACEVSPTSPPPLFRLRGDAATSIDTGTDDSRWEGDGPSSSSSRSHTNVRSKESDSIVGVSPLSLLMNAVSRAAKSHGLAWNLDWRPTKGMHLSSSNPREKEEEEQHFGSQFSSTSQDEGIERDPSAKAEEGVDDMPFRPRVALFVAHDLCSPEDYHFNFLEESLLQRHYSSSFVTQTCRLNVEEQASEHDVKNCKCTDDERRVGSSVSSPQRPQQQGIHMHVPTSAPTPDLVSDFLASLTSLPGDTHAEPLVVVVSVLPSNQTETNRSSLPETAPAPATTILVRLVRAPPITSRALSEEQRSLSSSSSPILAELEVVVHRKG